MANYYYDALNRRVEKNVLDNATETVYIYTGWQVVEEYEDGALARQYVFGGQYIDEPICKIEIAPDPDEKQWYMHDVNYNIIALVGSSQTPDELYNYEPYGTVTITDGTYNTRTSTAYDNTLMFQGRRYDSETGLYYYRNRYYSAELGRFVQRDPVGYVDGMNLYEGFLANPEKYLDPKGHKCTVFFSCALSSTERKGCSRDCEYVCTELRRTDSFGGRVDCSDLPKAKMTISASKSETSLCCFLTSGLYGEPDKCQENYSTRRIFGDWGILKDIKNCSRSKCRERCKYVKKICTKACKKAKALRIPCENACATSWEVCREGCNAVCENP